MHPVSGDMPDYCSSLEISVATIQGMSTTRSNHNPSPAPCVYFIASSFQRAGMRIASVTSKSSDRSSFQPSSSSARTSVDRSCSYTRSQSETLPPQSHPLRAKQSLKKRRGAYVSYDWTSQASWATFFLPRPTKRDRACCMGLPCQ